MNLKSDQLEIVLGVLRFTVIVVYSFHFTVHSYIILHLFDTVKGFKSNTHE